MVDPFVPTNLHSAEARRSYTWKMIDFHYGSSGQKEPGKNRLSTSIERGQPERKGSNLEPGASTSTGKGKEPQMPFGKKKKNHRSGKGTPITKRLHTYPLRSTPRTSLERSPSNNLSPVVGIVNQQKRKVGEVNLTTPLS